MIRGYSEEGIGKSESPGGVICRSIALEYDYLYYVVMAATHLQVSNRYISRSFTALLPCTIGLYCRGICSASFEMGHQEIIFR